MRILITFAVMMAIGYALMVLLLPAPEDRGPMDAVASSASILSQQAQALSKR